MKKRLTLSLLAGAALCLLALQAPQAAEAPADGVLKSWGDKATKSPVNFSHKKHAAAECKACHHEWDGKGPVKKCSDAACHNDMVEKKGEKSLYNAYHNMQSPHSCMGCHRAAKKDNKPGGPVNCNDCHPPKAQ